MSQRESKPISLRVTSALLALVLACVGLAGSARATDAGDSAARAAQRVRGGDRATALRIATALLAEALPLQVMRVRCEQVGSQNFCGLVLSGVKFQRQLDRAAFESLVDHLCERAFMLAPQAVEIDLWTIVPVDAGKGAVVSGDAAKPTSATVFAVTAHRGEAHPSGSRDVFWDRSFRAELERGSRG